MADIGNTDAGANARVFANNAKGLSITMAEDGEAGVTITCRLDDSATGDNFQAAIVSDADGTTVLAYSSIRTDISTLGPYTFSGGTLSSFTPANATTYRLVCVTDSADSSNFYHSGDIGLTAWTGTGGASTGTPPVITSGLGADAARDYSIYMTYTPAGGGNPLLLISKDLEGLVDMKDMRG